MEHGERRVAKGTGVQPHVVFHSVDQRRGGCYFGVEKNRRRKLEVLDVL